MKKLKEGTLEKLKNLWITIKYLFKIYCKTTTLHGFRYISDKNLSFIEKLIWAAICLTLSIFCIYLMTISYKTVQERRTIIRISDIDAPIHELDFPAVTICNFNKVYRPSSYDMERKLQASGYDNKTIDDFFQNLPQLIRPFREDVNYTKFNEMLYKMGNKLKGLLLRLMQPCNDMIKSCTWNGVDYNCDNLFRPVYSLMGHCCSFNNHVSRLYATKTYSPQCDKSYKKYTDNKTKNKCDTECPGRRKILKTPGAGKNKGLKVELDIKSKDYRGSTREYVGASIIIHAAEDYPEPDILVVTAQPEHNINIALTGTTITGTDDIDALSKTERNCVLKDEKYIGYSYNSCITGCKMTRIEAACDCIPYNFATPCVNLSGLCDFKSINCIQKYHMKITQLFEETTLDNGKVLPPCQCEETCNRVFYKMFVDIYRKIIPNYYYLNPKIYELEDSNINMSHVRIFFPNTGYMKYELNCFMTWDNLIANLGGLISLCLGGSLISILEPFIYFLLRHLQTNKNINH
ncbi:sodium channel protein Nach-like [Leptopilina boulardi]|uniref:sodium channel protein Nach-like n=1 Tax=Leptopilina boulardi TaxID=63433 RepID=UPI0021F507D2|nr:sodium channel protein Nach-like [Leptopilina boulardi]